MSKSCPHLKSALGLRKEDAKSNFVSLKSRLSTYFSHIGSNLKTKASQCSRCSENLPNVWACLSCEEIGCGRSQGKHASTHYNSHPEHCITVNLDDLRFWCYKCDDEVEVEEEKENIEPEEELLICIIHSLRPPPPASESDEKVHKESNEGNDIVKKLHYDWEDVIFYLEDDDKVNDELAPSYGPVRGLSGLNNIGNTCYMNSALQCLSNTDPLRRVFLGPPGLLSTSSRSAALRPLVPEFAKLMESIWSGMNKTVIPRTLHSRIGVLNPLFRGYAQHDSQEFLRTILDSLHEALKRADYDRHALHLAHLEQQQSTASTASAPSQKSKKASPSSSAPTSASSPTASTSPESKTSPSSSSPPPKPIVPSESSISSLFEGKLLSTVVCGNCKRSSETLDRFFDLSLSIPNGAMMSKIADRKAKIDNLRAQMPMDVEEMADFGSEVKSAPSASLWGRMMSWFTGNPPTDLGTLLHGFCVEDELTGADKYRCEHCKVLHDATKAFTIAQLPHILCLHIKRFKYDYFGSKVTDTIQFPLKNLDMTDFCSRPSQPDTIYAMATHNGVKADLSMANGTHESSNGVSLRRPKKRSPPAQAPFTPLYDLFAVICHSGSLHGGHYYAYAKNSANGRWYQFNDSSVREVDEETVLESEAYVLFYEQQTEQSKLEEREKYKKIIRDFLAEEQKKDEAGQYQLVPNETPYVSMTWLTKWLTVQQPGPLNAPGLLCSHRRLIPSLITRHMVPLPMSAAKHFQSTYGGQLYYWSDSPCPECERERLEQDEKAKEAKRIQDEIDKRRTIEHQQITDLGKLLQDPSETKKGYWFIHIDWVNSWLRFVRDGHNDIPGPIDNRPLLSLSKPKSFTYRAVNYSVWAYFVQTYGGGPEIWSKTSTFPKDPHQNPTYSSDSESSSEEDI